MRLTIYYYATVAHKIRVGLSRDLTYFDINMVGIAAGIVGFAVILAFLFNSIVATFTGLAYFELCSAILFSHFIIVSYSGQLRTYYPTV